ncbi:histidine phosphatase family protein [Neobacillus piezotolerans]|uniref:Histidine phosphatase family protein n=1 Tax=Neobacillus piezotolerans TaxID=2259171 RepID=A0A3D8GRY0_9BACI|nr:histidine phosphatase family protein [Neobacillus piezotolerans]RDU36836.1 histidine phosphatase family protein [Neobacillus piezotolerans]
MKTIYLIRHCQAEGQEREARLTKAGESQARELAAFLKNKQIDRIVSSPFERAVSTIRPFAEEAGMDIETDERLTERVLSGAPKPNWLEMLEKSFSDPGLAFEGGESAAEAGKRGIDAINKVLEKSGKNAVVVTHGNLMATILRHYDNSYGFELWKSLSNPDVFELTFKGNSPKIKRIWEWN